MKVVKGNKNKTAKITDAELSELQKHYGALNNIVAQLGEIEVRKYYAMKAHEEGENKLRLVRDELKKKYGTVNINIQTGEIKPSEDEANKKD